VVLRERREGQRERLPVVEPVGRQERPLAVEEVPHHQRRHRELPDELVAPGEPCRVELLQLEVVVEESDAAVADGDQQREPT
jgi:hypothetical protein